MKILFPLMLVLGFSLQVSGQIPYLNKRYERNTVLDNASLAMDSTSYYIGSVINTNVRLYHYTKIDFLGNITDTLDLNFNDTITRIENCKECLQVHKGRLYNMYTNFPKRTASDSTTIVLSKIQLDLKDTIETKVFALNGYQAVTVEASRIDSDSTFLISGLAARLVGANLQFKYDLLLAKFDTSFNLIWVTTLPNNTPNNVPFGPIGGNIVLDKYGGVLVSGSPFVEPFPKMGFAARFNAKTGASYWYKEFKGDHGVGGMYCANRDDGTYQFIQNWYTDSISSSIRFNIGVMDTMGNILSQKLVGENNRYQFCLGLIATLDGGYYAAGTGKYGDRYGFGFKFSSQQDSLWQGYYWHDDPWEFSWIATFQQKPDSNFVHFGSHFDHWNVPNGSKFYSWLLETDNHGCDTSGCNLGSEDLQEIKGVEFSIYPNPSRGTFQIKFEDQQGQGYYNLEIWDMLGRKVYEDAYWIEDRRMEVSTNLPQGVYNVILSKDGYLLGSEKLVLE